MHARTLRTRTTHVIGLSFRKYLCAQARLMADSIERGPSPPSHPVIRSPALSRDKSPQAAKRSYTCEMKGLGARLDSVFSAKILAHDRVAPTFPRLVGQFFPLPADLVLENLALHRQLLALHAQRPRRRLTALHKLFWVALRMCWSGWRQPLVLVTPRTVVNWQRAGFRLYWTWVSRFSQVGGQKRVSKEVRALIFRMAAENPTWGAPRIHGELLKLGFDLSEKECLAMDPASPNRSRSCEAMADVPQKPSRGHCCDGLFHRPNAHFGVLYSSWTREGHASRSVCRKSTLRVKAQIQSLPRLGGLHHRYAVAT